MRGALIYRGARDSVFLSPGPCTQRPVSERERPCVCVCVCVCCERDCVVHVSKRERSCVCVCVCVCVVNESVSFM